MNRLALLGASGHGKAVAGLAELLGWREVVFFDDNWPSKQQNGRWNILGNTQTLHARLNEFDGVHVSIGHCVTRWHKQQDLQTAGASIVTMVHPGAIVSPYVSLGRGSIVMAGAVLNVDVAIGEACIINTGATVDHDCQLACAVHLGPGARLSGNVIVGASSWLGVGSTILQGINIGRGVTVGAGAVVIRSVSDGQTVVGNPARPMQLTGG